MLIFVYGTLKRNFGNNVLLQRGQFVDMDVIDGYKLIYAGGYEGSFPFAIQNEGTGIRGEVFDISGDYLDATLNRLDQLEGHPDWYIRTEAKTRQQRDVEFYLMPMIPDRIKECTFIENENCFEWNRG